jgi:hypothetical protein
MQKYLSSFFCTSLSFGIFQVCIFTILYEAYTKCMFVRMYVYYIVVCWLFLPNPPALVAICSIYLLPHIRLVFFTLYIAVKCNFSICHFVLKFFLLVMRLSTILFAFVTMNLVCFWLPCKNRFWIFSYKLNIATDACVLSLLTYAITDLFSVINWCRCG